MRFLAPLINDISTDLDDPPELAHGKPFPPRFGAIVAKSYPCLDTLRVERPRAEVFDAAAEIARATRGWELTDVDPDAGVIRGVATTGLLRFKDDFAIRLRDASDGGGTVVDMRSKSRKGKGDFGANAERIEEFLAALRRNL